jgi:hypothetical protein
VPPRLQRCSSAKRRGCTSELTYSRSSWPVRRQGRSQSGNDPTRKGLINNRYCQHSPLARTSAAKAITLPRQGRFPLRLTASGRSLFAELPSPHRRWDTCRISCSKIQGRPPNAQRHQAKMIAWWRRLEAGNCNPPAPRDTSAAYPGFVGNCSAGGVFWKCAGSLRQNLTGLSSPAGAVSFTPRQSASLLSLEGGMMFPGTFRTGQ